MQLKNDIFESRKLMQLKITQKIKRDFFLLYFMTGMSALIIFALQNMFILGMEWEWELQFNLPTVFIEATVMSVIFYLYTLSKLSIAIKSDKKNECIFEILVKFPQRLFIFALMINNTLIGIYHIIKFYLFPELQGPLNVISAILNEEAVAMIASFLMLEGVKRITRQLLSQMNIAYFNKSIVSSLKNKLIFSVTGLLCINMFTLCWLFLIGTNRYFYGPDHYLLTPAKIVIVLLTLVVFSFLLLKYSFFTHIDDLQFVSRQIERMEQSNQPMSQISITSSDEIGNLYASFNRLQSKINKEYLELQEELRLAQNVQKQLLPALKYECDIFKVEAAAIQVNEIGGDLFDFFKVDDTKFVILIGDVSGKGIPAALMMSVMVGMVRARMQQFTDSPKDILQYLNQALLSMLSDGMYITAGVGILDLRNETLVYASAGHLPPLYIINGEFFYLEGSSFPLGIDEDTIYNEIRLPLYEVSHLLFYTDGIIEQSNREGEMLGFERLVDYIKQSGEPSVQKLKGILLEYANGINVKDDATMLLINFNMTRNGDVTNAADKETIPTG